MGKKDEIKAKYTISLKNVFNLEDFDGKTIFVAWKRGSKGSNNGETKKVSVSGKIAVFGEEFHIDSTLLQDTKSKKWESKKIEFTLKEEVKKKSKPLGKATLDLSEYTKNGQNYEAISVPISLKKKKEKSPSFKLSIKCVWTHFNKKKILGQGATGKGSVEVDGEKLIVGETEEDFSDDATTVGDHSSDDESDPFDDDFKDTPSKSDKKSASSSSSSVTTTKGRDAAPPKSSTTSTTSSSSSASSEDSKKRVAELERQLDERDRALKKAEGEVSKLKDELAKEKEKAKEKLMSLTGQKEEVKKLKKELADAKKKGSGDVASSSSNSSSSNNNEYLVASLKEQIEILTKEKSSLGLELSSLKKSSGASTTPKGDSSRALEDKEKEISRLRDELQKTKEELRAVEMEKLRSTDSGGAKGDDSVSKKDYDKVLKSLQKRNGEVVTLEKEAKEKDKDIEKLKDDVERLEKNLKGLYEVSGSKKSATGGNDNSAEVERLTRETKELKIKIEAKDKEIARLKSQVQELSETSKKSVGGNGAGGAGGGGDTEALKQKLKKMEVEREELGIIEDYVYCMTARYEDGIHVSAQQMADALMEKGAFDEPPNERLLARILNAMKKCYQADSYDNYTLVPWLSFACMLYDSLETEVGKTSEDETSGDIPVNGVHIPREGESHDDDDDDPVTIFFHNLEMLIFEIYSAVLRNFYTQLNDVVVAGILQLSSLIMEDRGGKQPPTKNDLKNFTPVLTECYMLLKRHAIFDSVLQQFFCQSFYFINSSLFNSLLKKKELCTCASGFRIKLGLSQLEEWTNTPKEDKKVISDPRKDKKILTFAARNYLKHITEAATVLVVGKDIFSDPKAVRDAFPTLSASQVKHLLQSFQPDQWSPTPVPKQAMGVLDKLAAKEEDDDTPFELDESYLLSLPK